MKVLGSLSEAMYTIGTAGHVDHGKSTLIKALTGIDPDRLPEEKAREMTIDLGFAWLRLPSSREVSIVDVPGHEGFIHNMLAGVAGIDLALLVVAADEGVMAQTREHVAILDLLELSHGVVAITKKDLVDEETLELVRLEVEELLAGTSLAGSPVVVCSAATGEGLPELVDALERELAQTPPRRDIGRPRLPIDRVFTLPGLGTVVTGTLTDGSLEVGEEVEVVPGGLRARIRGIHSHGRAVERAMPGRRTALNLPGLEVEAIERGMVVTRPNWLVPTTAVDVRLRVVPYLRRPLRHNMGVIFHAGTARVSGRLILLDRDEARAGEEAWAQLRLSRPVAVVRGDRYILRDPNDTLGGGTIVDVHAPRHRRFHLPTLVRLERLASGPPQQRVLELMGPHGHITWGELIAQVAMAEMEARQVVEGLIALGQVVALPPQGLEADTMLATSQALERWWRVAAEALGHYHRQWPLRRGMPREELRSRLHLPPKAFSALISLWEGEGKVRLTGEAVALSSHRPQLVGEQRRQADLFLEALRQRPYAPPSAGALDPELLSYLEEEGLIVRVAPDVAFAREAYQEMVDKVVAALQVQGRITLAQVRDMLGTSRKYAQALLEHMDRCHITMRVGDERVLRRRD
jgi:selenocysteine-specific elongation factor